MSAILVIWTVVAVSGAPYFERTPHKDWRPIGEFRSMQACSDAARLMGKTVENSRCLPTGGNP